MSRDRFYGALAVALLALAMTWAGAHLIATVKTAASERQHAAACREQGPDTGACCRHGDGTTTCRLAPEDR